MGGRTCIVIGCWSSDYAMKKKLKGEKEGKLSFFTPPRDPDLFEKWKKAIPIDEFRKADTICELHFLEDDIERFYITKLKDGTIDKIEKGRVTLKAGAVPRIFPDPLEIVEDEKFRKRSTTHHVVETPENSMSSVASTTYQVVETPENSMSSIVSTTHQVVETPENSMSSVVSTAHYVVETAEDNMSSTASLSLEVVNFSYETLLTTIMSLKKPNIYWGITPTPNFIVCARWNEDYVAEKRIVIEKNLNARVFFRDTELKDADFLEITDDNDVITLLQEVESYTVCAGASDKSRKNCLLCWKSEINVGRRRIWCKKCRDFNRNKARDTKRTVLRIKNLSQRNANLNRKYNRLKQKVDARCAVVGSFEATHAGL